MAKEKEEKGQGERSRAIEPSQERGGIGRPSEKLGRGLTPFSFMRRMMDDIDRLFGGAMLGPSFFDMDDLAIGQGVWTPQVEVFERNGSLVVRADLPGLDKDDVRVHLDEDAMTIEGERRSEQEETREGWYHSERSYGSFQRRIPLPRGIDRNTCDAVFENGVLEVTMKLPASEKQKVQIRGASTSGQPSQQMKGGKDKEAAKTSPQAQQQPVGQPPQNGPAPSRH